MTQRSFVLRRQLLLAGSLLPVAVLAAPACEVTAWQTKGPFFPEAGEGERDVDLTRVGNQRAQGEFIIVQGRVRDGACQPLAGVSIDIWQANRLGRYAHSADRNPAALDPGFQGAARATTDDEGRFRIRTIKPGAYALEYLAEGPREGSAYRAPHVHFRVLHPGYAELATQMYFAGEPLNDEDRVLARVAADERHRLISKPSAPERGDPDSAAVYQFDLTLAAA
jgi:protocatechuate 3,4-dioxygenase, beta subunit